MASKVYNKDYIQGMALLKRQWNVGDEIVYNSDPDDIGNEYLHLNYGTINNIFNNESKKQIIHIHLPYGKIMVPLEHITLQFIPKHRTRTDRNDSDCKSRDMDHIKRFFVYGTLRDDAEFESVYTKDWLTDCIAESGRLYKFKLFKERYEDLPFAVPTNDKNDYITGRILSWRHHFDTKLWYADRIEGFPTNKRGIVDVLNENGDMVQAIAYYRQMDSAFYDEIDHDWLKRDRSRDLSEYNPSVAMLARLQEFMQTRSHTNDLINSLPLPPEERMEYFRISGHNIAIIDDCKTVKKFRQNVHTAYGKYIVNSNDNNHIYKWTFKIKHGVDSSVFVIGISAKFTLYLNEPFYEYDEFDNYAYNLCNGFKVSQNMFQQYAIHCKTSDILDMELNMGQSTLGYYINGRYLGVAYDDVTKDNKISYQMAVSLEQHQDEITLQSFKIMHQLDQLSSERQKQILK